ncbi:uncharacterized protein [Linepithema humile]|uniref:uncharacterized protein n=1 Tax=Linepithema humile TaxID=83485 RepID=UPI00351EED86
MKKIIVLFGIVACSYGSHWNYGNYGELTLGEIAIDQHSSGTFNLGESHSLDFLGGHSPILNEVSNWPSDINNFHGAHVIPVVKHIAIGIPTITKVPIGVPHPLVEAVPQPYPVTVVIPKPVPYEVEKQVVKTVEKKVLTPVEKIVPVKIEKLVPFRVVKHVPVPFEKPIPIKIPIYKTIIHKVKGH